MRTHEEVIGKGSGKEWRDTVCGGDVQVCGGWVEGGFRRI